MAAINRHHARRSRSSFDRFINRCEGDAFSRGVNDHAPAGQRCDDLIVVVLASRWRNENRRTQERHEEPEAYGRNFSVTPTAISRRAHLLQFTPPRPSTGESPNLALKTAESCLRRFPHAVASAKIEIRIQPRKTALYGTQKDEKYQAWRQARQ